MLTDGKSLVQLLTTTAIVRICGAGAQLGMTIAITQSMARQAAGAVLFAYALVMLVSQVSLLGTEVSGLRAVAIDAQEGDGVALQEHSAVRIRLVLVSSIIGGISMVALIGSVSIGDNDALSLLELSIVAATIPLYALVLLLAELLKGIGKPVVGLAFQNVFIPVVVVAMILVRRTAAGPPPATYVIVAIVIACLIAALAILAVYSSNAELEPRSFCLGRMGKLIREAPWVAPVSATPAIIQWSGAALLGVIANPTDVATYVVAARVTIAVSIIHSAVASVAGPRLAISCHSGDFRAFRAASVHTGLLIAASALPLLLLLFFFPRPVLEMFGSSYAESGSNLLRILLLGQIVAAICGHSGTVLLMAGKFRIASANSIIVGAFQLSMTLVLVPLLGALGAALATTITVALGHISALILVKLSVGLWPIPLTFREIWLGLKGRIYD